MLDSRRGARDGAFRAHALGVRAARVWLSAGLFLAAVFAAMPAPAQDAPLQEISDETIFGEACVCEQAQANIFPDPSISRSRALDGAGAAAFSAFGAPTLHNIANVVQVSHTQLLFDVVLQEDSQREQTESDAIDRRHVRLHYTPGVTAIVPLAGKSAAGFGGNFVALGSIAHRVTDGDSRVRSDAAFGSRSRKLSNTVKMRTQATNVRAGLTYGFNDWVALGVAGRGALWQYADIIHSFSFNDYAIPRTWETDRANWEGGAFATAASPEVGFLLRPFKALQLGVAYEHGGNGRTTLTTDQEYRIVRPAEDFVDRRDVDVDVYSVLAPRLVAGLAYNLPNGLQFLAEYYWRRPMERDDIELLTERHRGTLAAEYFLVHEFALRAGLSYTADEEEAFDGMPGFGFGLSFLGANERFLADVDFRYHGVSRADDGINRGSEIAGGLMLGTAF
ncbi:DUF3187 family protein [bacterium]|nr:DUF3187 family protein [bacterium]